MGHDKYLFIIIKLRAIEKSFRRIISTTYGDTVFSVSRYASYVIESKTTKDKLFVDISCGHLEQLIQKLYEVSYDV